MSVGTLDRALYFKSSGSVVLIFIRSICLSMPRLMAIGSTAVRSALGLADDDVRAQAAWYFQSFFRGSKGKAKANAPSARDTWSLLGKAFFAEVWPLEPTLQSSKTAPIILRTFQGTLTMRTLLKLWTPSCLSCGPSTCGACR